MTFFIGIKIIRLVFNENGIRHYEMTKNITNREGCKIGKKGIALIVIVCLVIGGFIFTYLKSDDTEEQIAIGIAKGIVTNFFVASFYVETSNLEPSFSDIEVELVKEETESEEGTYEVSGAVEIVLPEKEETAHYTFKETVLFYNGAYIGEAPHVEEVDE